VCYSLAASRASFTSATTLEYIAFYPACQPGSPEEVYLLAGDHRRGIIGAILVAAGWRTGRTLLRRYGRVGPTGLLYTLALCSEHTLAMNFSIWFEAAAAHACRPAAGSFAAGPHQALTCWREPRHRRISRAARSLWPAAHIELRLPFRQAAQSGWESRSDSWIELGFS
jgi:hypothetical protein